MTDPKGAAWPICEANQICAIVASSSGRGPGKELVAQQRMLQHCDQGAAWGSSFVSSRGHVRAQSKGRAARGPARPCTV